MNCAKGSNMKLICVGLDCNICRKWWEEPYKEQTVVKGGEV